MPRMNLNRNCKARFAIPHLISNGHKYIVRRIVMSGEGFTYCGFLKTRRRSSGNLKRPHVSVRSLLKSKFVMGCRNVILRLVLTSQTLNPMADNQAAGALPRRMKMSNNAYRVLADRRADLRAEAIEAYFGLDRPLAVLADEARAEQAAKEWAEGSRVIKLRSGKELLKDETKVVDHRHLIEKVQWAATLLGQVWWPETDRSWARGMQYGPIPYNFATPGHTPWRGWDFYNSRKSTLRMERGHGEAAIDGYLRTAGFLRACAEGKFPALKKVLEKTQGNGANSPYTLFTVFELALKLRSPGRAERMLWKVRHRAEAILTAYEGYENPSWKSVALGLLAQSRSVGKAAVMAVAGTISGRIFSHYREAREWLVDFHLCKVVETSDGVVARREIEPRLQKMRVAVYRIAMPLKSKSDRQVGIRCAWLVRSESGRTYHHEYGEAADALRAAVTAWKRQDELTARNADLIGFLQGEETGYCPLVTYGDSYQAGNCRPGTKSWLSRQGWANRDFIPGVWLIPHLNDERVRRVVVAARGVLPLAA